MTAWLAALASLRGANLLRVKALLNVDGDPLAVHAVQTLIHEPLELARWPDADRPSRLVFITRHMSRAAIENALDLQCLRAANPLHTSAHAITNPRGQTIVLSAHPTIILRTNLPWS